jgi:hypothetical protein
LYHCCPVKSFDLGLRSRAGAVCKLIELGADLNFVGSKMSSFYANDGLGIELNNTVYALDSTTIDLCDWAPFRSTKAAIKLHTLLDLRGAIPAFIHISEGKLHDVSTSWASCRWRLARTT